MENTTLPDIFFIKIVKSSNSSFRVGEFISLWFGEDGDRNYESVPFDNTCIFLLYPGQLKELFSREIFNGIEVSLVSFQQSYEYLI